MGLFFTMVAFQKIRTGEEDLDDHASIPQCPLYGSTQEGSRGAVNEYLAGHVGATGMGAICSWLQSLVRINLAAKSPNGEKELIFAILPIILTQIWFPTIFGWQHGRSMRSMVRHPLQLCMVDKGWLTILIDEARTPLIVSGASAIGNKSLLKSLARTAYHGVQSKTIGFVRFWYWQNESYFKLENLYDIENVALTHFYRQCLRANYIMILVSTMWLIEEQEILIVDQFTGHAIEGRRASWWFCTKRLKPKERCANQDETKTGFYLLRSSVCIRNWQELTRYW